MTAPADVRAVRALYRKLRKAHPDAHCELDHESPYQLLIATVLSAQTTDKLVNQVTPAFFARWPDPESLAAADVSDVEQALSSMGMFRQKAKRVTALARLLLGEHEGGVPNTLSELVALPGVGRKTANVVLGVAFSTPEGVVVDTHVLRLAQRLGWTSATTPDEVEQDLMRLFPRKDWDLLAHTLIFHGRRVCSARSPACAGCSVREDCPSAFDAEHVGRKTGPKSHREASKKKASKKKASKKKASKKKASKKKASKKKAQPASKAKRPRRPSK